MEANGYKEQLREAICKEFKRLIKKHPEDNLLKLAYKQEYINN